MWELFKQIAPSDWFLSAPVLIVVAIFLIILLAKRPKLGVGLLAATGILGFIVSRNKKLDEAFQVESDLAGENKQYAQFKNRMKNRYKAVSANQDVLEQLRTKVQKLKGDPDVNAVEISLLEKEIAEREEMNKRLLDDVRSPFQEGGSITVLPDDDTFGVYDVDKKGVITTVDPNSTQVDIQVDGFRLVKGK